MLDDVGNFGVSPEPARVATRPKIVPLHVGLKKQNRRAVGDTAFSNVTSAKMTSEEVGDEAVVSNEPNRAVHIGTFLISTHDEKIAETCRRQIRVVDGRTA